MLKQIPDKNLKDVQSMGLVVRESVDEWRKTVAQGLVGHASESEVLRDVIKATVHSTKVAPYLNPHFDNAKYWIWIVTGSGAFVDETVVDASAGPSTGGPSFFNLFGMGPPRVMNRNLAQLFLTDTNPFRIAKASPRRQPLRSKIDLA